MTASAPLIHKNYKGIIEAILDNVASSFAITAAPGVSAEDARNALRGIVHNIRRKQ